MAVDLLDDFRSKDVVDEREFIDKKQKTTENLRGNEGCAFDVPEDSTIRILEEALEEEQTARAALCSELEQERSAAATAADEAMAMILRLQEEKASIEIESRQYQRILEEKSAYDAEEMEILKEIIIRREREKHFMEKELEAYRNKMLPENEQVEAVMETGEDPSEDPMLMLQQLNDSLTKSGKVLDANKISASTSVVKQNTTVPVVVEFPVLDSDEGPAGMKEGYAHTYSSFNQEHLHDGYKFVQEFQEKGTVSMDELPFLQHEEKGTDEIEIHSPYNRKDMEIETQDIKGLSSPLFLDVHVVNDEHKTFNDESGRRDSLCFLDKITRKLEVPSKGIGIHSDYVACKPEQETNRSNSDMFNALPPLSGSRNKYSQLRRHSITAVDHERLKINSEVGFLRERLKIIQEGRQKLNMTSEHRERERTELQLLEDIVHQLQEIRQLTGLRKAARQSSLPPPSSKATSKKKRSRSASVGVYQSS